MDNKGVNMLDKILNIMSEQLGVDKKKIKLSDTWEELGADSLDQIELVMAYEEEFGIEIPDEDVEGINNVEEVIKYLEGRLK